MNSLSFKIASSADESLYLQWANDVDVRKNSFNQAAILPENHHRWFTKKIQEKEALLLIFLNEKQESVGQVRIDKDSYYQVDISVDKQQRGKGYALQMLQLALLEFVKMVGYSSPVFSLIKKSNLSSIKTFEKAGFTLHSESESEDYFKYIFTSKK
jgi:UDP-2,4-diacetamido-2,4,6-trideoxy-beta-L-altropyranose hydrolase